MQRRSAKSRSVYTLRYFWLGLLHDPRNRESLQNTLMGLLMLSSGIGRLGDGLTYRWCLENARYGD